MDKLVKDRADVDKADNPGLSKANANGASKVRTSIADADSVNKPGKSTADEIRDQVHNIDIGTINTIR